jgi:hypothetical protein
MKDWAVSYQDGIGIFDGIGCFIPCDGSRALAEFAAKWFNKHRVNGRDDIGDIAKMWDNCFKEFWSMNHGSLKIEHKPKGNTVEVGSLFAGQMFEHCGRLMIKMSDDAEDDAFDFTSLDTTILAPSTKVTPRNATLTVEN